MTPSRRYLLRYATLGMPLAFVGLPIYVHLPKFYGALEGMNLALLGVILLLVRLLDCCLDPLIGWLCDRFAHYRRRAMMAAVPLLMAGYALLFHPPAADSSISLSVWLSASLILVYLSYSVLMICYYASAVGLAQDEASAARVAGYRETAMLLGVLLASILPAFMAQHFSHVYHGMSIVFAAMLAAAAWITLPLPIFTTRASEHNTQHHAIRDMLRTLQHAPVRHILIVLLCNAIPSAITGTLFLFYCADVLHASDTQAGLFLLLYFISAAMAIPLWTALGRRVGLRLALTAGMLLAIASFIFAYGLGSGDQIAFSIICVLSGAAVGADLVLLPALFSHRLKQLPQGEGVGFGLWHFTSKLTLALAAGIALPLLAWAGYTPGGGASINVLSLAYALIPCILKLLAVMMLLAFDPTRKALT